MSPWGVEAWRLFGVLLAGALVGLIFGSAGWGIVLVGGAYFAWQIHNLYRLERWLGGSRSLNPPEGPGIWGVIYGHFYRLQRRNRRRKRRLAAILHEFQQSTAAFPDGTVLLTPDGSIVWFNGAAGRLLGLRYPQDVGQRVANLVRHPQFTEYLRTGNYEDAVEVPSPVNEDMTLALQVVPYGDEQRLMIVRDVTRLHKLEQVRRDFVANASHELRTPLTVVSGYLDSLLDEPEAMARWSQPLQSMREQAGRMEHILEDLLLLSRMEGPVDAMQQQDVDMPELLEAVAEQGRKIADGALEILVHAEAGLRLRGAERELHSIAANLVTNAVKYTPAGGRVEITWGSERDGAFLAVSDTGIGIPEKDLPRITERFYRVDTGRSRRQGGTGLGLSIVRNGVLRHDGRLEIRSRPGEGSTFTCHFPEQRLQRQGVKAS
ncbi:MAG TPA: phosphate regulon sensor histidine kinase PhoR [Gammaproteobacteria bacterium]|nr:phosphate regulon sensor histidine kinase PhoR [Gammaproteobacteria bacterium]